MLWEIRDFLGRNVTENYANRWYQTLREKLPQLNSTRLNCKAVWDVELVEKYSTTIDSETHTLHLLPPRNKGNMSEDVYKVLQTLNGLLRRCACQRTGCSCRTLFIRIKAQKFCDECRRRCAPNVRLKKHRAKKNRSKGVSDHT